MQQGRPNGSSPERYFGHSRQVSRFAQGNLALGESANENLTVFTLIHYSFTLRSD